VVKSPTMITLGSICALMSSTVCFMQLGVPMICVCLQFLYPPDGLLPLSIWSDLLCLFWITLVWSHLCQIWVQVLLSAFKFCLLGKSFSILSL
jgi:hypothetical protein